MIEETAKFEGGDFVRSEEFHTAVESDFTGMSYPAEQSQVDAFVAKYSGNESDAQDACEVILSESEICLNNPDATLLVVEKLQPKLSDYFLKRVAEEVLRRNTMGIEDIEKPNQSAVSRAREILGSGN